VPLTGFRPQEVKYTLNKENRTVFIHALSQTHPETHKEIKKTIQLPKNIDIERVEFHFNPQAECLVIKAPFLHSLPKEEEWRKPWNKVYLTETAKDLKKLWKYTDNEEVRKFCYELQELLLTRDVPSPRLLRVQLVTDPIKNKPIVRLDFNMTGFRPEDIKFIERINERICTFEANCEQKSPNQKHIVTMKCREEFCLPEKVNMNKLMCVLKPNGILRVTVPCTLNMQLLTRPGMEVPVKRN